MPKPKKRKPKRVKKGIESLEKQVEIHEEKLRQAIKDSRHDLAAYYEKEIRNKKKDLQKKKKQLK